MSHTYEETEAEKEAARRTELVVRSLKSVAYFILAVGLCVVMVLSNNVWWNIPGVMAMYTAVHNFKAAWRSRKK